MWDLVALISMAVALLAGLANGARSVTHRTLWHVSTPSIVRKSIAAP